MRLMHHNRRDLLKLGASGACLLAVPAAFAAPKKPRKIPIALQLYSIREECKKDLHGTLAKVKEMGFEGVEFAGYHQYEGDAAGLKKRLAELKLGIAGTHVKAANFEPDKLEQTIAFHKALGCKYLIVPGDGRFSDKEKSVEYARLLTATSKALKRHGLFCGHHNHTSEFEKAEGDKTYWDLFAERTPKEVILQQDIGWTTVAGLDPVALIKKHPGRTKLCHIKAKLPKGTEGKKPILGQDVADWRTIVAALSAFGGTEWLTVEQEDYPDGMSPLEASKASLDGLKKLLAA
jgi:sugar phosphate isomerase/epimerase